MSANSGGGDNVAVYGRNKLKVRSESLIIISAKPVSCKLQSHLSFAGRILPVAYFTFVNTFYGDICISVGATEYTTRK